jgi:hypothetical protein
MTRRFLFNVRTIAFIAALAITAFGTPQISFAAQGDCGQPVSNGNNPVASDALNALNAAVGLVVCDLSVCDVNCSGTITAPDALSILNVAVSLPVEGFCDCGPTTTTTMGSTTTTTTGPTTTTTMGATLPGCSSAQFFAKAGSDLDTGWKGTGHNAEIIEGASITFAVLKRCSSDDSVCRIDTDCPSGTCDLTCDCNPGSGDTECEVTGPTTPSACSADTSLPCATNQDCVDAAAGTRCVKFFGPPLPLVASGVPVCVTTYFQEPLTGTANSATGEGVAAASLKSRVHLGIGIGLPCPGCLGAAVGDVATCTGAGSPNEGLPCTVHAISPLFGGVSSDCPPVVTSNISGEGLNIGFKKVTTGTASKTATLPCGFGFHPSLGNALCLDNFTACTSNNDCPGSQCGVYCHCGFCDGDSTLPCFDDGDCDGGTCGSDLNVSSLNQYNSNACQSLVCGEVSSEQCCVTGEPGCAQPTGLIGECIDVPTACGSDLECQNAGSGDTCILTPTPCFESTITRTGVAAPLGKYCTDDPNVGACTNNGDCAVGTCVPDSSEPVTAALFCVPATASSAINGAAGTPGPGAIAFKAALISCRCQDNIIGCDEECDDGNNINGDGCDQACRNE